MVIEGRKRIPEGRPLLAILPFQGSTPGSDRYAGFGEGLASYFSRMDPRDLGVLGPASTADRIAAARGDAREVGRQLDADMILMGREVTRASTLVLVAELLDVDSGALLCSGEYTVGEPGKLRVAQTSIGAEVTEVLDLPR
jgi:TolB-like protein